VPADAPDRHPQRLGDTHPGPLRGVGHRPIPSTQPHRGRHLLGQHLQLETRPRRPLRITEPLGLIQILPQLDHPPAIGSLGRFVQHRTDRAAPPGRHAGLGVEHNDRATSSRGGDQIQRMKLPAGLGQ